MHKVKGYAESMEYCRTHTVRVNPNNVFIELHQYDEQSMQQHGGVCVIDYVPRPRAR